MQCVLAGGINLSKKSQHTANLIHAAKFSESANRFTQQNESNLTPCNKFSDTGKLGPSVVGMSIHILVQKGPLEMNFTPHSIFRHAANWSIQ